MYISIEIAQYGKDINFFLLFLRERINYGFLKKHPVFTD